MSSSYHDTRFIHSFFCGKKSILDNNGRSIIGWNDWSLLCCFVVCFEVLVCKPECCRCFHLTPSHADSRFVVWTELCGVGAMHAHKRHNMSKSRCCNGLFIVRQILPFSLGIWIFSCHSHSHSHRPTGLFSMTLHYTYCTVFDDIDDPTLLSAWVIDMMLRQYVRVAFVFGYRWWFFPIWIIRIRIWIRRRWIISMDANGLLEFSHFAERNGTERNETKQRQQQTTTAIMIHSQTNRGNSPAARARPQSFRRNIPCLISVNFNRGTVGR